MDFDKIVDDLDETVCRDALKAILAGYCSPAFGALPKREIDLLFFELLYSVGVIGPGDSLYTLMRDLRVTRPKARALMFEREVRRATADSGQLDAELRTLLGQARFVKDGTYFVMEVENPLLQDHLREHVRKLNYLTDTSFNPQLVRVPVEAVTALSAKIIPDQEQEAIRKALVKAGMPDGSFTGVLKGALKVLGEHLAKEAGGRFAETVVDNTVSYLKPVFGASGKAITESWKGLLKATDTSTISV